MTTLSQTYRQSSPNEPPSDSRRPRHTVRTIIIAIVSIAVLGAGGWMLWRTPALTSVPIMNAPVNTVQSASTLRTETVNTEAETARATGSRATSARGQSGAAARSAEESNTVVDEVTVAQVVATDSNATTIDATDLDATAMNAATASEGVSQAAQTSQPIVTIAGINGAEMWQESVLLQTMPIGARLTATARSADGLWLYMQADEAEGWVEAAQVYAFGLDSLPVLDTMPATMPETMSGTVLDTAMPETAVFSEELALEVAEVTAIATAADVAETEEVMTVSAVVTLSSSRLNVRSGPTTDSTIIAKAYPDEEFTVLASDESGEWLQIGHPDVADGFGWVSASYMAVSAPIDTLPVSAEVSNAPAFESEPIAATVSATTEANGTTALVDTTTTSASASPNGLSGTLAFQSSHGMIYAYDLATATEWPLTTGFDPAISPDGTTVAFTRDEGGQSGLYLIDINGSNEQRIFLSAEVLSSPKWSPDGNWLVFSQRSDVEVIEPPSRRGNSDAEIVIVPEYEYQLAVVDHTGANYHEVASLTSARAADWTTAGIVYQSSSGIQVTADTPDAENQLVTFDYLNPYYYDPDWQPTVDGDGGQIVFMQRGASHWEIYVVNPDGSGLTALTKPVTTLVDELPSNVAPAYSPDGQHIIYLSNRGDDNAAGAWQIWVMAADGSNPYPLPIDVEIEYTFGNEQAVSWGI